MKPHVYLFTDGSCGQGADIGAWAAFVVTKQQRKILYGTAYPTTVSRCELIPIIEGLRWIQDNIRIPGVRVRAYSDSEYTVRTLCGLCDKKKNLDLWPGIDAVCEGLDVEFIWRARNTHPYMELCDAVASVLRRVLVDTSVKLFDDRKEPEKSLAYVSPPDEGD